MSSTTSRAAYADRRANGAYSERSSGPRMSAAQDRPDSRYRDYSPQPDIPNPSHKRTASGNTRPSSRAWEERRTEKSRITTQEILVSRTKSPERRNGPTTRKETRPSDTPKARGVEPRVREPVTEVAPQGTSIPRAEAELPS